MLNVLLVIPRYLIYGNCHYVMPMGILYVSAYMKLMNVARIHTLNLNHHEGDERQILHTHITKLKIDVLGIGGLSGEYRDLRRITCWCKEDFPKLKLILGGGIVTADPVTTMRAFPEVDYGIVGEGEITMCELIRHIETSHQQPDTICGLAYRIGNAIKITASRSDIEVLDKLPLPDYEGFDYREYLAQNPDMSDEGKRYSQVSVIGGRSCKYNCTFCFHPTGSKYRQRSLDSIFSEINYLVEHYDISYIALREELFATDNARIQEFCRRVEPYHFDWSIQLRIDNINESLVRMLQKTRCRYVFVGVESACDEVLKSMRKGITINQIENALQLLHNARLNFRTGVILGDTADTFETACRTLDWFEKHRNTYRLYADMIIAFPGSVLYKRAVDNGIIPDPVKFLQDSCPVVNVSHMGEAEFQLILERVSKINNRIYNYKRYHE